MKSLLTTAEYKTFLKEIKERIHKAQYDALKAVNKELINLYRDIGKSIVAKQDELGWGKAIVETLAKDLQKEFPGMQGFSARNLWNMRTFYLTYKEDKKLQPLVAEISWTKNVIIMERCKDDVRREFYIKITKKFGWTKDVLINQLEAGAFERYMANQTNFDKAVPAKYRHQAKLSVKDEYSFDFLELGEEHSEKELERGTSGKCAEVSDRDRRLFYLCRKSVPRGDRRSGIFHRSAFVSPATTVSCGYRAKNRHVQT